MNINWVVANTAHLDPNVNLAQFKEIGSIWGSWQTWSNCQTDNVICHNATKAQQLIENKFPTLCNFYIPNALYIILDNPVGVHTYGGDFAHEVEQQDEIVAMHLSATVSDVVLLIGFEWHTILDDQLHVNYRNLVQQAIAQNAQTQWVLIDHPNSLWPELANLANLTKDTLDNVIKQLT
jgi:hypothetical protein